MSFKQFSAKIDLTKLSEKEQQINTEAILWALTYEHLEVFSAKEFKERDVASEYALAMHTTLHNGQEIVLVNTDQSIRQSQAEEVAEIAQEFGFMGFVAWQAYRESVNDVIHECFKTDAYNGARKKLGLGAETQMEEEVELMELEEMMYIIFGFSDGLVELVPMDSDEGYQAWTIFSSNESDDFDEGGEDVFGKGELDEDGNIISSNRLVDIDDEREQEDNEDERFRDR